jgi:hypothetical protein
MRLDDAGEFVVQSAVEISEFLVIDAHEMKNCRVEITKMSRIHDRSFTKFSGFTWPVIGFALLP